MAKEWIDKAEGDYKSASVQWDTNDPVYDDICFHAQQCVEKYLKAWLAEKEMDFPKTHDLEALAKLCLNTLPKISELFDELRFLTAFAVEIRYPGTFAQKQDAERCWLATLQVRTFLREKLGVERK
jgi:HEPN domain-containing protein